MTRFGRAPGVVQRALTDGVIVLAPGSRQPVSLAGSAVVVWDALAEPREADELVRSMQARFRGDPDRIAADVDATLANLVDAEVVVAREVGT